MMVTFLVYILICILLVCAGALIYTLIRWRKEDREFKKRYNEIL
jgi:protein-S-isoprenylcysteine O-methyltransferase Ste14